MKRYIHSALLEDEYVDVVFAMTILRPKYLKNDIRELVNGFIYISPNEGRYGPRIKFYGGSNETKSSRSCPTIKFDKDGNCELVLAKWMNKDNCPNAFDKTVLEDLGSLIRTELPVLLLLWFNRLSEDDVIRYMEGLRILLSDNNIYLDTNDLKELDKYCRENNLYSFEQR